MDPEKKKEIPQPIRKVLSSIPWDHISITKINPDTGEVISPSVEGIVSTHIRPNERVTMMHNAPGEGIPHFRTSLVQCIFIMSDESYWVQTARSTYRVTQIENVHTFPRQSTKPSGQESIPPKKTTQWTLAELWKLLGLKG